MFDTRSRALALALAADALLERGAFAESRPTKGNIHRMIGQARQECLRALRISFEEGDIDFDELMSLYQVVDETAKELAWERWLAMNPERDLDVDLDDETEVVTHERVGWHGDREVMVRPVREDWHTYEDHGFTPLVPVGDVLAFGGVA